MGLLYMTPATYLHRIMATGIVLIAAGLLWEWARGRKS